MKGVIPLFFSVAAIVSCTGNDNRGVHGLDPDALFFDYKIRGWEKDSNVTVYIQYRVGGPNGLPLRLKAPSGVTLDDEAIPLDSAKLTGTFYEIQKPAYSFNGLHTIVFRDKKKKDFEQEFVYRPFSLRTPLRPMLLRGDIHLEFDSLADVDYVTVTATDTSYTSKDINEIDTARNGKLVIPAARLKNLVSGPIILLLTKETEKVIKNGKREGRVAVSYGIQREFLLSDSAAR